LESFAFLELLATVTVSFIRSFVFHNNLLLLQNRLHAVFLSCRTSSLIITDPRKIKAELVHQCW